MEMNYLIWNDLKWKWMTLDDYLTDNEHAISKHLFLLLKSFSVQTKEFKNLYKYSVQILSRTKSTNESQIKMDVYNSNLRDLVFSAPQSYQVLVWYDISALKDRLHRYKLIILISYVGFSIMVGLLFYISTYGYRVEILSLLNMDKSILFYSS